MSDCSNSREGVDQMTPQDILRVPQLIEESPVRQHLGLLSNAPYDARIVDMRRLTDIPYEWVDSCDHVGVFEKYFTVEQERICGSIQLLLPVGPVKEFDEVCSELWNETQFVSTSDPPWASEGLDLHLNLPTDSTRTKVVEQSESSMLVRVHRTVEDGPLGVTRAVTSKREHQLMRTPIGILVVMVGPWVPPRTRWDRANDGSGNARQSGRSRRDVPTGERIHSYCRALADGLRGRVEHLGIEDIVIGNPRDTDTPIHTTEARTITDLAPTDAELGDIPVRSVRQWSDIEGLLGDAGDPTHYVHIATRYDWPRGTGGEFHTVVHLRVPLNSAPEAGYTHDELAGELVSAADEFHESWVARRADTTDEWHVWWRDGPVKQGGPVMQVISSPSPKESDRPTHWKSGLTSGYGDPEDHKPWTRWGERIITPVTPADSFGISRIRPCENGVVEMHTRVVPEEDASRLMYDGVEMSIADLAQILAREKSNLVDVYVEQVDAVPVNRLQLAREMSDT